MGMTLVQCRGCKMFIVAVTDDEYIVPMCNFCLNFHISCDI